MNSPKSRLFVDSDLRRGQSVPLSRPQTHFLINVLRLGADDFVSMFNGRDGEWLCRSTSVTRKSAEVRPESSRLQQTPEPGPWLAFAPIKKARTDYVVEKAMELGVERLIPVFNRLTSSERVNSDRLLANAREAAEQCGRLTVPEVSPPCRLAELLASWPQQRPLLVADETGNGRPIADVLADIMATDDIAPMECGFLVGPECGFDPAERRIFSETAFCRLFDLGPRILRSETAAVAALSCAQALTDASN